MEKLSIAVFMKQSRDVNTTNPNPKTETKLNWETFDIIKLVSYQAIF